MNIFEHKIFFQAEGGEQKGILSGSPLKGGVLDEKIFNDSVAKTTTGGNESEVEPKSSNIEVNADELLNQVVGRTIERQKSTESREEIRANPETVDDDTENLAEQKPTAEITEEDFSLESRTNLDKDLNNDLPEQIDLKQSSDEQYEEPSDYLDKKVESDGVEINEETPLLNEEMFIGSSSDQPSLKETQRILGILRDLSKEITRAVENLRSATMDFPQEKESYREPTRTREINNVEPELELEVKIDGITKEALEIKRARVEDQSMSVNLLRNKTDEEKEEEELARKRWERVAEEYYDDIRTAKFEERQRKQFLEALSLGGFELDFSSIKDLNERVDLLKTVVEQLGRSEDALAKVVSGDSLNAAEKLDFMNLYVAAKPERALDIENVDEGFARAAAEVRSSPGVAAEMSEYAAVHRSMYTSEIEKAIQEMSAEESKIRESQSKISLDSVDLSTPAEDQLPTDPSKGLPGKGPSFVDLITQQKSNPSKYSGPSLPSFPSS